MIAKTFEIRDEGTHIPALAICLEPDCEADRYVFARAGFGTTAQAQKCFVMLMKLTGNRAVATYDPFQWDDSRTMREAHRYIESNFGDLRSGEVIDVQFILGETKEKKKSEACGGHLIQEQP
jgi:hypothetical protein